MKKVSDTIRARLEAAGQRYRANDNIAAFIEPAELDALTDEVAEKVTSLLQSLVIDTENDHNTRETGARVARMYLSDFAGRYAASPDLTAFPNVNSYDELYLVGPITIRSTRASSAEHPRQLLDRHLPGQERPRPVEVLPADRMDRVASADPGGDDDPDRRSPRGRDLGGRHRRGSRPSTCA